MKIPLAVSLDIQGFTGGTITDYNAGLTNLIATTKGKVTQRPSITISESSSLIAGLSPRARGIYYWETSSKKYIINDNSLYEVTQDSTRIPETTGIFSGGTEKCTILETVGTNYLIILDAENNKGWVMTSAKALDQIASNFPSTLTHGGAILNGHLFVMDENGFIFNSNVNDPRIFNATGFILAERDSDKGVYLAKHHDNLVAFGTRTIEFFYYSGNSVGSPLTRRGDISFQIGCYSGLSVWEDADIIYFIGRNSSGQLGVYNINGFQINKISNDGIDSYITNGISDASLNISLGGVSVMGHTVLLMTVYTVSLGNVSPYITLSFDSLTKLWGFWSTALNGHTTFPLMAWTKRTGGQNSTISARTGEGILSNGDILSISDDFIPIDKISIPAIYESGINESGIYAAPYTKESNISFICRTGLIDGETSRYKFQSKETLNAESTQNKQTLTIKHSNESTNNFGSGKGVDTSIDRKSVFRGGRFMKRNFQLEYAGNEQLFMESLDIDLSIGT